jgi:hypothetical protein
MKEDRRQETEVVGDHQILIFIPPFHLSNSELSIITTSCALEQSQHRAHFTDCSSHEVIRNSQFWPKNDGDLTPDS